MCTTDVSGNIEWRAKRYATAGKSKLILENKRRSNRCIYISRWLIYVIRCFFLASSKCYIFRMWECVSNIERDEKIVFDFEFNKLFYVILFVLTRARYIKCSHCSRQDMNWSSPAGVCLLYWERRGIRCIMTRMVQRVLWYIPFVLI